MTKVFKLKNGTILLSTEAPGGLYNSDQLREIGAICESDAAVVKATEDQRLALYVKEDQVEDVKQKLEGVGLGVRNYQDGLHQPLSCLGELCEENEQDALSASLDITEVLADIQLESPLKIGINGCATCCVPCHTLDVSILGEMNGYKIFLGGKNSQIPEMAAFMAEGVPADKLPELIRSVICLYKDNVQDDESLQDVLDRLGPSPFVEALAPYSADAAGGSDDLLGDALSLGEPDPPAVEDTLNLDDLPDAEELDQEQADNTDSDIGIEDVEVAEDDLDLAEDDLELNSDVGEISVPEDDLSLDEDLGGDETSAEIEELGDSIESLDIPDDELDIEIQEDSLELNEEVAVEGASQGESDLSEDIALEDNDLDAELAADLGENDQLHAVSDEAILDEGLVEEESIDDLSSISDIEKSEFSEGDVPEEIEAISEEQSSNEEEEAFEEKFSSELDQEQQDESLLSDNELENDQMREDAIEALSENAQPQVDDSDLESEQVLENLGEIEKISNSSGAENSGWKVKSINTEHADKIDLHFSNGARVSLSSEELENGEHSFEVNGTEVFVSASAEGVCVNSCGIEVVLPKKLAS